MVSNNLVAVKEILKAENYFSICHIIPGCCRCCRLLQVPETPRPILPSPEPGEESSGSPLFNLKKFQTPTQCRSRNSITYTRDMFLKKVVDPEKKEERQRKKDKKK